MILTIPINLIIVHLYLKNYLKQLKLNKVLLYLTIYPMISFAYILTYFSYGLGLEFIYLSITFSIMILIIVVDMVEMLIPDKLVASIVCLTFIYHLVNFMVNNIRPNYIYHLSGALLGSFIFVCILIISKGGIGLGDITLISAVGLILGPYYLLVNIIISFILGSLISIFLLLTKIKNRKDPIPFAPFIILSFFITKLYGSYILNWYLNLLTI